MSDSVGAHCSEPSHMRSGRNRVALGFVVRSLPAYAVLFVIHAQSSLRPLLAERVPPDLGYSAEASPLLEALQVAALAYLFAIYGWTLATWKRDEDTARSLMPAVVLLTLAAWTLLPANSSDILEYLGVGRLFGLYGLNPYTHTYSEITDAFSSYVPGDNPMPYGPPLLPMFTAAGILSVRHVLLGMYALKLAWAALHLVNVSMLYRIARHVTDDAVFALFAFACNPLILFETVGNGHNDGVMIFCGLAALLAMLHRHEALAIVFAFVGAILKLAGILWVLAIVVLLVRRRHWRALTWGALASAMAALMLVLWPGCLDALTVLNSQWHYSSDSLHTILIHQVAAASARFSGGWDYDAVFQAERLIATPVFVAVIAWRLRCVRDIGGVIRESGYLLLALLVGYAVSAGPWYFTWLLPTASLTDSDRLRRTILVTCASVIVLYAFPFATVEPMVRHQWAASLRLLIAFGAPCAFFLLYPLGLRVYESVRTAGPGRWCPHRVSAGDVFYS